MLNWLTDEYINPKYMGLDAVLFISLQIIIVKALQNGLMKNKWRALAEEHICLWQTLMGEKLPILKCLAQTINRYRCMT